MNRRLVIWLGLVMASGCYSLQPIDVASLAPGQIVNARITGAFADSLGPILQRDARTFEGSVVEASGSSVFLDVAVSSGYQGMQLKTLSQRIEVPRSAFVEVSSKELSRSRTFMALGALAAVSSGLVISQLNSSTGGAERPGQGGPVESRVPGPSFSVPIGFGWVWGR